MLKDLLRVRNAYKKSGLSFNQFKMRNMKLMHELDPFLEAHKKLFRSVSEILHWLNGERKLRRCAVCGKRISYQLSVGDTLYCSRECRFSKQGNEHYKQVMLERHGVTNPSQKEETKQKVRESVRRKYGVDNVASIPEVQEKMKKTMLERYGVDNSFALDKTKEKIRQTNIEKYGVPNPNMSSEFRKNTNKKLKDIGFEKIWKRLTDNGFIPLFNRESYASIHDSYPFKCQICGKNYMSKFDGGFLPQCPYCKERYHSQAECEIGEFIQQYTNCKFNDRTALSGLTRNSELDIYCLEEKIAFEFDGLYYHGSQFKDKNYHLQKTLDCAERGIRLIHIFEDEWIYKKNIVKSRIKAILGKTPYKIQARKCEVCEINSKTITKFLEKYHIQGVIYGKINLGLFYKNRLVAVMNFSKSRFAETADWELLRYCTVSNFNIIGGAGKLLSYFRSKYNGKIITYADRRWSNGNLYEKLGFKLNNIAKPGYFYVKNNQRFNRVKFQKHKLPELLEKYDPTLSEWENMKNNKFDKIYDCGNLVYVMD